MRHDLDETDEYLEWFESQSLKVKSVVSKRLKNIIENGYFGDFKCVSQYDRGITKDLIFELRWNDGKRIYYGKLNNTSIIILFGGNKNGQEKDIKEAKKIFIKNIK